LCGGVAACAEEGGEHGAAFFREDAFGDFNAVVECRVVHDGEDGDAGTGLGVARGEDKARDARVEDGPGAHGAGLKRAEEAAPEESIVAEREAGGAEGDDLGVGSGVVRAKDLIVANAENFASG